MKITEHFDLSEFACKDGTEVPLKYLQNVTKLAEQLEVLRAEINKPIVILSGFRTFGYNEKVGGVLKSMHLTASAADIMVRDMSSKEVFYTIENLIAMKKMHNGGLGVYPIFCHYDIRNKMSRW